jgi:hypothetical protein
LHFGQELVEGGDAHVIGGFAGFGEGAGEVLCGGWVVVKVVWRRGGEEEVRKRARAKTMI